MIGNDELSQRAKFLFVSYTGPNCKVLRKARVSVHVADVKRIVKVRRPKGGATVFRPRMTDPCAACRVPQCRTLPSRLALTAPMS